MTDSQILTLNERVKGFSSYFFNLSAALIAASFARIWVKRDLDFSGLAWMAAAFALLWLACGVLYLLEPTAEEMRHADE